MGGVFTTSPFHFVSFSLFLPHSHPARPGHNVLSSKILLCFLGLLWSEFIVEGFSMRIRLISRAWVESEYVAADVVEWGRWGDWSLECADWMFVFRRREAYWGGLDCFVWTHGGLVGVRSYEFDVDIDIAGAGAQRRSLGVQKASGTPSMCNITASTRQ